MDAGADGAPSVDAGPRPDAPPPPPPFAGTITGRVISGDGGVEGAIVGFGGHVDTALSGPDGDFTLVVVDPPVRLDQLALTAGKEDYYSAGVRVEDPAVPQQIAMEPLSITDDPDYEYKSADDWDSTPFCIHCHTYQRDSWAESTHSLSAKNPLLHDLYNGTAMNIASQSECEARGGTWRSGKAYGVDGSAMKCYVDGGSVLADLNPGVCGGPGQPTCDDPTAPPGNRPADLAPCGDCHAPGSRPYAPGATDLNAVDALSFDEGVLCDFCHKIRHVTVNDRPGINGAIELLRPGVAGPSGWAEPEVHFGPHTDVIVEIMDGSYQPQFRTSELCSACHQWLEAGFRPEDKPLVDPVKWPGGLPIQDTYDEWTQSPMASAGIQCQACHQPGAPWERSISQIGDLDPEPLGTLGWPRVFGEVRDHTFKGRPAPPSPGYVAAPGDPPVDVLRDPISVRVTPTRTPTTLDLQVRLSNSVAGHSLPTGTPSRALLLLVQAESAAGPVAATGGYTVPGFAGALESDVLGPGNTILSGDQLTLPRPWPAGVGPGSVIRFVAPSGVFADYPGIRWFGDPARTPAEKGMEIVEPVETAGVIAVSDNIVTLDRSLALPDGTLLYAGDPGPSTSLEVDDELPSGALAGAPGWAFGKVMRGSDGTLGVPFFRATDIASDNRIPAGAQVTTTHAFDVTGVAGDVTVTVTLLYRRLPYPRAMERAWPAVDQVRKQAVTVVPP